MRILLIQPGQAPILSEFSGTLESMQRTVGGCIEILFPFDDPVALVCHEEGKLLGLPLNRSLRDQSGQIYDVVAGPLFLCGAPTDSECLDSIPDALIEKYRECFAAPEIFINLNGKLLCIPVEDGISRGKG